MNKPYLAALSISIMCGACSKPLIGDWKIDSQARGDPFVLTDLTIKGDGSYQAKARSTGLVLPFIGTYQFDGFTLTLSASGKPDLHFAVRALQSGQKLELRRDGQSFIMNKSPVQAHQSLR